MANRDDDFLGRWSRRKAEARHGLRRKPAEAAAEAEPGPPTQPGLAPANAAPPPEPLDAAEVEKLEQEIDALDYESDFSRFLKAGIPGAIKQKALRKLWSSNPLFGTHDGLDDYYVTADFTDAARAVPNVASSWRPGKGYATDEELAEGEGEPPSDDAAKSDETAEPADRPSTEAADQGEEDAADTGADGESIGEASPLDDGEPLSDRADAGNLDAGRSGADQNSDDLDDGPGGHGRA